LSDLGRGVPAQPDGAEEGGNTCLHSGAPGDTVRQASGQVVKSPVVHTPSSY
jgi:hypothetical protein